MTIQDARPQDDQDKDRGDRKDKAASEAKQKKLTKHRPTATTGKILDMARGDPEVLLQEVKPGKCKRCWRWCCRSNKVQNGNDTDEE